MIVIAKEIQTAAYLFASILFILSLGSLSSQESAKRGVFYGIIGMAIAIIATVFGQGVAGHIYIIAAIAIPGLLRARISGNEASAIGSLRAVSSAQSDGSGTGLEIAPVPTR